MRKLLIAISLVLLSQSCTEEKQEYHYYQLVIKNKRIDYDSGTRYNIAFTNGESRSFTFGIYSNYEIGDTICLKYQDDYKNYFRFHTVVNCKYLPKP